MAKQELCYVDVGGTFTDSFVVDDAGDFVVAKAPSTPGAIADGFMASIRLAAEKVSVDLVQLLGQLRVVGFGSTTVLNALLTRRGGNPGLLITRGFEALLQMGRGKETWVQLHRADRIHPVTHRRQSPLIPRWLVRGVSERVDSLGREIIPLFEEEVRAGTRELIDAGVDSIVITFLWSFLNDAHERRAAEIALEEISTRGSDIPVVLSSQISPTLRELPRANATTIEAFAGPSTLQALRELEERLQSLGFGGNLQVMQSAGGLAPAQHVRAIDTIQSGPVGGLIGARFIGELYGFDNVISTDVGGTSFDVGLISGGFIAVDREPVVAGLLLALPMMEVVSIGAGGGTLASIDPLTGRLVVGPESAGAVPGPVCYGQGGRVPTVTDADVVLGYINPEYFIGGRITIDPAAAHDAIREQIAEPLGLSVEAAAEGIRRVIDTRMRETVAGLVATRGYGIDEYHLLTFGGAGPTHVAGYTEGLPLKGVLAFPYSAAFSAFGAAASDYEHHYTRAVNAVISPDAQDDDLRELGERLSAAWERLEDQAAAQMRREGFGDDQVQLRHLAMVRYGRQLNDLIVNSPVGRVREPAAFRRLLGAFEEMYARVYAKGAQYPQAGFEVFEVGVVATAQKVKPRLVPHKLNAPDPAGAEKGVRQAYFQGMWMMTQTYEWLRLESGNRVAGPAIIEDSTTTLVLPPGWNARVDEYRSVWLEGPS